MMMVTTMMMMMMTMMMCFISGIRRAGAVSAAAIGHGRHGCLTFGL